MYDFCRRYSLSTGSIASSIANLLNVGCIDQLLPGMLVLGVLPAPFCRERRVVAIKGGPGGATFAVANPFDPEVMATLNANQKDPKIALVDPEQIDALLDPEARAEQLNLTEMPQETDAALSVGELPRPAGAPAPSVEDLSRLQAENKELRMLLNEAILRLESLTGTLRGRLGAAGSASDDD